MTGTPFLSPVGRWVQGSPFKAQTTNMEGQPLVYKTGPNAGQPRVTYFMAVAFAKTDPQWPAFEQLLKGVAASSFGHLFPQGAAGPCSHPGFAFKIVDGDGVDQTGKPNSSKEGFAGHWVVRFSSGFAPQVFPNGKYSPMDRLNDDSGCVCGHYVRVSGTIDGNGDRAKPGLYVNMQMVEHVGFGDPIVSGPDPREVFGRAPAVLPPGARPTPAGAPAVVAPTAPAAPATPSPAPSIAAPGSYSGFMQPPAPPVPAGPRMTAKANGMTREAFIAAGWTDEALRANGYMD